MTTKKTYYYGTGKRKASIARVKIFNTNGKIQVNGKSIKDVLVMDDLVNIALLPLKIVDKEKINFLGVSAKYLDALRNEKFSAIDNF